MKTRALRMHVAAYDSDHWMLSVIEDTYDRGQLKNSDLIYCQPTALPELRERVEWALQRVIEAEAGRVALAG